MLKEQPQLNDEVVSLKELATFDTQALFEMRTDEDMCRKAGLNVFTHISEAYAFILNVNRKIRAQHFYYWGIYVDQSLVGVISMWSLDFIEKVGELGYFIGSDYVRQGYMSKAVKLVVNYVLLKTDVNKLAAYIEDTNQASINLVEKLGFVYVDKSIEEDLRDNTVSMYRYEISQTIK